MENKEKVLSRCCCVLRAAKSFFLGSSSIRAGLHVSVHYTCKQRSSDLISCDVLSLFVADLDTSQLFFYTHVFIALLVFMSGGVFLGCCYVIVASCYSSKLRHTFQTAGQ